MARYQPSRALTWPAKPWSDGVGGATATEDCGGTRLSDLQMLSDVVREGAFLAATNTVLVSSDPSVDYAASSTIHEEDEPGMGKLVLMAKDKLAGRFPEKEGLIPGFNEPDVFRLNRLLGLRMTFGTKWRRPVPVCVK